MLYVMSEWKGRRFAFPVAEIVEVLPCLDLQVSGRTSLGMVDYHGAPLPVIDLCTLLDGLPTEPRTGTRLLILRTADAPAPFGALVPNATGTDRFADDEWTQAVAGAEFVATVASRPGGLGERVSVERLRRVGGVPC